MQWSDIQFRPPIKTLRQFAGLWLACFGGLAVWEGIVREHTNLAVTLTVLALTIGPVGIIWPRVMRPIYVAWMVLAFPIGWTVSQVILALMFYGLFTPIGLIFRIIGRDPLHRARRPGLESYWSPKATPADPRRYFKQF
jgi:Saxitoxin biosynthesis operon protein SxtJ